MSKPVLASDGCQAWLEGLSETAILETDPDNLSQRIQDAQDAIMDEIEDSFQTASSSERQALINAMNGVRELRRISGNPRWKSEEKISNTRNAA